LRVRFLRGARIHRLRLRQENGVLAGDQQSEQVLGAVSGRVEADQVRLRFDMAFEGATIVYTLEGRVAAGGMAGTAEFGFVSGSNNGVVNRRQYGGGAWEATRLGYA
jgi:hypothetical protein